MYDVKCYELAEAFLSDEGAINTTRNTEVIAQMISGHHRRRDRGPSGRCFIRAFDAVGQTAEYPT